LTGAIKYGYNDLRPALERASARETAARVAVGGVCKLLLARFEIDVFGYVIGIGPVEANVEGIPMTDRHRLAEDNEVRCPDINIVETMISTIRTAIQDRDTLGGVIEVVSVGVPPGLGSYTQWDKRLEARLGAAVLGIPAVKGVEVGMAFENTRLPGSQVQDAIRLDVNRIVRPTNRAGGLEGGITNGNPIVIRAAMKPIATTLTPQQTVDLAQGIEVQTQYQRSDFCPVPRTVPIVEAAVAFVLADALLEKVGGDSVDEIQSRIKTLRQMRLQDLLMDNEPHRYWAS
jgi:chorismate synthase